MKYENQNQILENEIHDERENIVDAYRKLISGLTATKSFPEDFNNAEVNPAEPIARTFGIRLITVEVIAPPNPVDTYGQRYMNVLYDAGGSSYKEVHLSENSSKNLNDGQYMQRFDTNEHGSVFVRMYPFEGNVFDSGIEDDLKAISQIVFSYGGRARLGKMVESLLLHDAMTGLPNLDMYMRHIAQIIANGQIGKYDAFYLNIRNFKYINKIVKPHMGDEVMVQYARRLRSFAHGNEIIARLGGDNYVALIERERKQDFINFFSNIELQVDTKLGLKLLSLGAAAGIYELPDNLDNTSEIMLCVSLALQAAKQIYHRPYVIYSEEIAQKILAGQRIIVDFEKSLEKKEFVPFYQPKVITATGKICGAEALARWNHNGGIVPPGQFVPILEQDGTICRLDFDILRQTCISIADWISRGIEPVRISVNFSRWNLQNDNLVEDIMAVLKEYKVDPKYIEAELTESVDSEEYPIMTKVFSELRKNGIATSIDDFGTGYSSLTLIKNLAVDVLKLDRSFISEIGNDEEGHKDRVLISNIINMAGELDMKVLAEGVETNAQRDFLQNVKCDMIQGFLYAKPLPIEEFEKMAYK